MKRKRKRKPRTGRRATRSAYTINVDMTDAARYFGFGDVGRKGDIAVIDRYDDGETNIVDILPKALYEEKYPYLQNQRSASNEMETNAGNG